MVSDAGYHAGSELLAASFRKNGYCVVRNLASDAVVQTLVQQVDGMLSPLLGPAEYESDVGYPGAPDCRSAEGGETPRRLLHAWSRGSAFMEWAASSRVSACLESFLGTSRLMLSQSHHNCIMTKHPGYSSRTDWHQDNRYWSYDRADLVSVWLALGSEHVDNGCMQLIPGSHTQTMDTGRFDKDLFLRPELDSNQELIRSAVTVEMQAGDVLFFHSQTFHAAGKNCTGDIKKSLVFTYHAADNHPIPGTRSARYPSITL